MGSNVITAVHHLRIATEYMDDFVRSSPGSRGGALFKVYSKKVKWILNDILTFPFFSDPVREGIRREMNSDPLAYAAIMERVSLLNPTQREQLESVIEDLIAGKKVEFTIHEK
jgi:hypothetical protein